MQVPALVSDNVAPVIEQPVAVPSVSTTYVTAPLSDPPLVVSARAAAYVPATEGIVRAAWAASAMGIGFAPDEAALQPLSAALVAVTLQVPPLVADNTPLEIEQPAVPASVSE